MRLALSLFLLLANTLPLPPQRRRTTKKPIASANKKADFPCGNFLTFDEFVEEKKDKWRKATESETRRYYYNTRGTCDAETGVFKTWVRIISKDRSERVNASLQLLEFNCRARQSRLRSQIDYALNGDVIDSRTFKEPEWVDVVPESVGEGVLLAVCHLG